MKKDAHAREVAARFRELVNEAGESLRPARYEELELLVEAAIDTALMRRLEGVAETLDELSRRLRHEAESFDHPTNLGK